jgi:transposase-like protein
VAPPADRPSRSAAEKLRILQEYETYAPGSAERGALLRREGVYTSQISKWRKQRERGALQALAPQPPGPKPLPQDPLMVELTHLRQETARLQARLAQAELIIDVQKKVAQLLGAVLPPAPPDEP